jgi:hypothetical protein
MMKAGDSMKELRLEIEEITDADDRSISECTLVVISAAKVGADVDRLVENTGLRRDLVEAISHRMRAAKLWIDELVDYREWRDKDEDKDEDLMKDIFKHALVAEGSLLRECDENGGCAYFDPETGERVDEWHPAHCDFSAEWPN